MVNAIPELNLPVLNFVYPNREPTGLLMQINDKQPENIMKIKGIPKALGSEQFCDGMTHVCFVCGWFFREFKVTLSI